MENAQMRLDLARLLDWIRRLERDGDLDWAGQLEYRADELIAALVDDRSQSQAA